MTHVRYLKENNVRYRTLSATEIPLFIAAAEALNTPAADAILLALYTGMRIGEVCTLKWDYWHPDAQQLLLGYEIRAPIHLPACKSRSGHYSATGTTGTQHDLDFPALPTRLAS
jgi:hypothetical protein